MDAPRTLLPLPHQPADVPWPADDWPEAPLPPHVDARRLERALATPWRRDTALGDTHAVLIVHRGAIVAERYGPGVGPSDTLKGWSLAKSVLHAVLGILVRDGRIDIDARADVPEWTDPDDPRRAIRIDQLLRMSSGLAFVEDYTVGRRSDIQTMLWGEGRHDMAAYAASLPLVEEPGCSFRYGSGNSVILAGIVRRILGGGTEEGLAFLRREIFGPLGMRRTRARFDAAGTFIASSGVYATARDFARFGLFYLRDGCWQDRRILPPGWVDHGRTPSPTARRGEYGAHFWLRDRRHGGFAAHGFEGQRIAMFPALDLVIVRLGTTAPSGHKALDHFCDELVACFATEPPGRRAAPAPRPPDRDPR